MNSKEANGFFKDKFKQSLRKDMIFWISTIASVVFTMIYYILEAEWYANFVEFLYFNWSSFGFWIGALFLLTRNYNDVKNLKSHHLKSLCRILLLVLMIILPLTALVVLPVLGVWWVIKTEKKRSSNEESSLGGSNKPTSKIALASLICSGLASPLLFGITILQDMMISSGLLHRRDALASTSIGFLTGLILSIIGIVLWTISRKHEGRHVWNFWAMRLIIVNVILAPFALFFMFAIAIGRAK
jgi:hypothetical protein